VAVVETAGPTLETPEAAASELPEAPEVELPTRSSIAGASARAEFERRRTRDRAAIRKQRPLILAVGAAFAVGGLLLAAFGPVPAGALGPSYRMLWLLVPIAAISATLGALFLPNDCRPEGDGQGVAQGASRAHAGRGFPSGRPNRQLAPAGSRMSAS
jgi:hypothetical protein